jgi:hypothetical protein
MTGYIQSILAVLSGHDPKTLLGQVFAQKLANTFLIIYNKDNI